MKGSGGGYDRTHDGRAFRSLTVLDEYTRECLAIKAARRLNGNDVLDTLTELFLRKGIPCHIREPGSPWENGYIESFNGKLRD